MRILFVTNAGAASGAEEHLLDLSSWLSRNGVDLAFLAREEGSFKDRIRKDGYRCHTVNRGGGVKKPLSFFQTMRTLLAEKPDVVSINREHDILPTFAALLLVLPLLKVRPKLVAVFHTPTGRSYPVLRFFDGVVATSRYTADAFLGANPDIRDKVTVLRYGIAAWPVDATARLDRNRERKYFRDRGFPVIGMVGELWKNQEELVEAARRIVREIPEITIAIVGSGYPRQVEVLAEKIRGYGLERNFVLTGRVPRTRMPDIFHDFDLSVSTHRNEGFGIVHIESLACFTPVVAYNVGGYVEMLREGGGILVEGGTDAFADTVVNLIRDDARRKSLGREGRAIVETAYTIERMGKNHLDYYRGIVSS